jgi:hypothetical protein
LGRWLEVTSHFCLSDNCAAQRMLRVQFKARGECKDLLLGKTSGDKLLGQLGFAAVT